MQPYAISFFTSAYSMGRDVLCLKILEMLIYSTCKLLYRVYHMSVKFVTLLIQILENVIAGPIEINLLL